MINRAAGAALRSRSGYQLSVALLVLAACRNGGGAPPAAVRAPSPAIAAPRTHDHQPRHGGAVSMVGQIHVEAVAAATGSIRLYVTDLWRQPLPLDGAGGTVRIRRGGDWDTLPLAVDGDALLARGRPLSGPEVILQVTLSLPPSEPIEANFLLPLANDTPGTAGVRSAICLPPPTPLGGALRLRCTLQFDKSITSAVVTPDSRSVLIAAVDSGVSVWDLGSGRFQRAFRASPSVAVPGDEAPHAEAVNVLAISPDGTEVAVAVENRALVYRIADGSLVRQLPAATGFIRAMAWTADGRHLLVSRFYDRAASLLDASDGHVVHRLEVEREAAVVASDRSGARLAVASELGPITLFAADGSRVRALAAAAVARVLTFAGSRLIGVGDDGMLRSWKAIDGEVSGACVVGTPLSALAIVEGDQLAVVGGLGGTLRLVDLQTVQLKAEVAWHTSQVVALAYGGGTLVSGDIDGHVAFWDLPVDAVPSK